MTTRNKIFLALAIVGVFALAGLVYVLFANNSGTLSASVENVASPTPTPSNRLYEYASSDYYNPKGLDSKRTQVFDEVGNGNTHIGTVKTNGAKSDLTAGWYFQKKNAKGQWITDESGACFSDEISPVISWRGLQGAHINKIITDMLNGSGLSDNGESYNIGVTCTYGRKIFSTKINIKVSIPENTPTPTPAAQ